MKRRPEQDLQRSIVKELPRVLRPGVVFYHPANGGKRSAIEAAIFTALGVRPGVSDLAFILPPHGRAAFIELKAEKGELSDHQREFRADCLIVGALWAMCRTFDEAMQTLSAWGALRDFAGKEWGEAAAA